MKKICVITTISKTMDWFICDSTRNLYNNGYDITLICNMDNDFADRNEYAKCISLSIKRGVNIKDILPAIIKLTYIFKKEKFDIVQYTTPNAAFYASVASFIARVPIRLYSQWGIRYIGMKGIKRQIFKFIEKITCYLSTDIREVSQLNRKLAIDEKLCPDEKISVIGRGGTIGVDLSKCDLSKKRDWSVEIKKKYNIPDNRYVYGYLGRINADKGINELLSSFKEIIEEDKNVHLMLVGMYDYSNPIDTKLLNWAQNSKYVTFVGNVPNDEIYQYIATFDVLTHPTYREGFGKVLQEAMGMEIPIITTNIPGPSEVIEKNVSGLLVEPCDINDLKRTMIYIKKNTDVGKKIAKNARNQAEKYYDRKIMLQNIYEDMESLISKRDSY